MNLLYFFRSIKKKFVFCWVPPFFIELFVVFQNFSKIAKKFDKPIFKVNKKKNFMKKCEK